MSHGQHIKFMRIGEAQLAQALKVGDTVLWEDFANRKLEDNGASL